MYLQPHFEKPSFHWSQPVGLRYVSRFRMLHCKEFFKYKFISYHWKQKNISTLKKSTVKNKKLQKQNTTFQQKTPVTNHRRENISQPFSLTRHGRHVNHPIVTPITPYLPCLGVGPSFWSKQWGFLRVRNVKGGRYC